MTQSTVSTPAQHEQHTHESARNALVAFLRSHGFSLALDAPSGFIHVDVGAGLKTYAALVGFGMRDKNGRTRPSVLCAEVAGWGRYQTVSYKVGPVGDAAWLEKVVARLRLFH